MVRTGKTQWLVPSRKDRNLLILWCLSKSNVKVLTSQVKKTNKPKNMLIIFLEYIPESNHIVHNLFNVCSNHTTFKLQRTRIQNMLFELYISDIHVTLKQSQGHQSYNDNVDPKQGYHHAKFERSCFNGFCEKVNVKVFFKWGNKIVNYLPWTWAKKGGGGGERKKWCIHDLLDVINKYTKFQLNL